MSGCLGLQDLLLLIMLGLGYIVLYFAKREEREWHILGGIIGTVLMFLALVMLIFNSVNRSKLLYRNIQCNKAMQAQESMMQKGIMPQGIQPGQKK